MEFFSHILSLMWSGIVEKGYPEPVDERIP